MVISGSQGTVRIVKRFGKEIVEKRSKYVDYSLDLEHSVLKAISKCDNLAPYFPRSFGFKFFTKKKTKFRALLMEKIDGEELDEFVKRKWNSRNGKEIVENITLSALCLCDILRTTLGIVHNDLHASNVLVTRTERDYFSFRLDGGEFSFKTFGYCPVIIDFGFAFVPDRKIMAPPNCTDIGYSIGNVDPLTDCRILLSSVKDSLKRFPETKFTRFIGRIFGPLDLDENGWFREGSFYDLLNDTIDLLTEGMDIFQGTIFDPNAFEIELVIGLFIAQTVPRFEEEYFDEKAITKSFINLVFSLMKCEVFLKATIKRQLLMIKDLLSEKSVVKKYGEDFAILAKPAKRFSEQLSFFVNEILITNSCLKEKMYSELSVTNTVDVLKEIGKFKNCSKFGPNARIFDFGYDQFMDRE